MPLRATDACVVWHREHPDPGITHTVMKIVPRQNRRPAQVSNPATGRGGAHFGGKPSSGKPQGAHSALKKPRRRLDPVFHPGDARKSSAIF